MFSLSAPESTHFFHKFMLSSLQYMEQFESKFVVRINVSSQTFSEIDTIRVTVTIINERHL